MVNTKQKVLVTGASGYLGAHISQVLAQSGYRVTAFCRSKPSSKSWVKWMENIVIGDIRDNSLFSKSSMEKFDIILHLVSLDHHKSNGDPNFVASVNVTPTWQLLKKYTSNGLKKFINFSTIHVYGDLPSKVINENFPLSPQNPYAMTHLLSENICSYYNKNSSSECINVRLSNSFGSPVFYNNNCWWLVINDLCKNALSDNMIKLSSDGTPQRDFIHINNVIKAIETLIQKSTNGISNIFHIASSKTRTIHEISYKVKQVFKNRYGKNINIFLKDGKVSNEPRNFNLTSRYTISSDKLKLLGCKIDTDLGYGINELFNYLENYIDV